MMLLLLRRQCKCINQNPPRRTYTHTLFKITFPFFLNISLLFLFFFDICWLLVCYHHFISFLYIHLFVSKLSLIWRVPTVSRWRLQIPQPNLPPLSVVLKCPCVSPERWTWFPGSRGGSRSPRRTDTASPADPSWRRPCTAAPPGPPAAPTQTHTFTHRPFTVRTRYVWPFTDFNHTLISLLSFLTRLLFIFPYTLFYCTFWVKLAWFGIWCRH